MILELKSVHKSYGDKPVLRGIDLSIDKGTFLALLGPSGCGKTTLLHLIAGLTSIDEGQIVIDGTVVSEPGHEVPTEKREIGMVFQDFALWPHMTVFEIVAFGLKLHGVRGRQLKERVAETLAIFHMENYMKRYPHELSGGQKQRIAMARAIAPNPRLILMDEPLSSLDTALREEMRVELARIFKQLNMTVIYVTHDQKEAMSMADTITILKGGLCEQVGAPEVLYNEPASEYVAKFMGPANILRKGSQAVARFIRPKDVRLSQGEGAGQHVTGEIKMRTYLGEHYRYFIETPDYDDVLEVTEDKKIPVGATVHIHIPPEKCRNLRTI